MAVGPKFRPLPHVMPVYISTQNYTKQHTLRGNLQRATTSARKILGIWSGSEEGGRGQRLSQNTELPSGRPTPKQQKKPTGTNRGVLLFQDCGTEKLPPPSPRTGEQTSPSRPRADKRKAEGSPKLSSNLSARLTMLRASRYCSVLFTSIGA